ncbi:hypothetical protein [Virgisporangium aliadipatigenens]|uniref:hypothetical protein n=1 Tax=Virgisporangium aliadipatigenens TaxID=741659 RepID=UPI001940C605|nr:hypothetical protein [Virgisporangium aliadipatigenens]
MTRARRRLDEIRPARPRKTADRRRTYTIALFAVALLTAMAWLNDHSRFAVGFLVALILGLLWVAWEVHRALLTSALAILWWVSTTPAVGVLSTMRLPALASIAFVPSATTATVALGAVVWLCAMVSRAPRPAATIMLAWAVNFAVLLTASLVAPRHGWLVGYVVTIAVLVWRLSPPMRSRRIPAPPEDDPDAEALHGALRNLGPGHSVGWRVPTAKGRSVTVVTGSTGTFAVHLCEPDGEVGTTGRGTRLVAGGTRLDRPVRHAASAARRVARTLRTPVQPVLVVSGAEFPTGIMRTTDGTAEERSEVLVIRADLLAGRLGHGPAVLTGLQVRRLARRMRSAASV